MWLLGKRSGGKGSAWPAVQGWIARAAQDVEVLEPGPRGDVALARADLDESSVMGAVVLHTGGVIIDGGWLRILGAGNPRLERSLPSWNEGRADGMLLVADDVLGGVFAVNKGALGEEPDGVFYLPPDTLEWEAMNLDYAGLVRWAITAELEEFYQSLRWSGWREAIRGLGGDQCIAFAPPLWLRAGDHRGPVGKPVTMAEMWMVQLHFRSQLGIDGVPDQT